MKRNIDGPGISNALPEEKPRHDEMVMLLRQIARLDPRSADPEKLVYRMSNRAAEVLGIEPLYPSWLADD